MGTWGISQGTKIEWKEGNNLADKVRKKLTKPEPEQFTSVPFGVKQPSFFVWFTDDRVHPAEDRYSTAIKKHMWPNPLVYFVLPLEVHVKRSCCLERYEKEYPEIIKMIKSGEYEKKYGKMEKEGNCSCDKCAQGQFDPNEASNEQESPPEGD